MIDLSRVLRSLEDLESGLEELYAWFAEIFGTDPEAAALFSRMSREERGHRNMVAFELRLVYKEKKAFAEVDVDWNAIRAVITDSRKLRDATPTPSLEQAVSAAIDFESNAAELYFKSAIVQSNHSVSALINTLAKENKRHFLGLKEFAEDRGMTQGS